jgi:hypothetical protein
LQVEHAAVGVHGVSPVLSFVCLPADNVITRGLNYNPCHWHRIDEMKAQMAEAQ